jgi:hypothetical protein
MPTTTNGMMKSARTIDSSWPLEIASAIAATLMPTLSASCCPA